MGVAACCGCNDNKGQTLEQGDRNTVGPGVFCQGDDFASVSIPATCFDENSTTEQVEVLFETQDTLRRRLTNIANADEESSAQAQAYADVLVRVLDALTLTMQSFASTVGCNLSDPSVLMIVVAPEEEVLDMVVTPEVLVLTQEPGATSVHDDRFKKMVSKLCGGHVSHRSSRRDQDPSAKHIVVSHSSGEILATSATFQLRKQAYCDITGGFGAGVSTDARANDKILSVVDVATVLTRGVVFAAFEQGSIVVLPAVDMVRGRAFRLVKVAANSHFAAT